MDLILTALSGLALLATLILTLVLRTRGRRYAASVAALQEQLESTARARGFELQSHESLVRENARHHARETDQAARSHAAELQSVQQQALERAAEYDKNEQQLLARMQEVRGYDLVSQLIVRDALEGLSVNGAMFTNTIFVPEDAQPGKRFPAQIDHILVIGGVVLLIESKYWAGLIFDGVDPSAVHAALGNLLPPVPKVGDFAMQIKSDSATRLTVRLVRGPDELAPRAQARLQASRLHAHLTTQLDSVPWLRPVVFYSHASATVHHADPSGTMSHSKSVVTSSRELRELVRQNARSAQGQQAPDGELLAAIAKISGDTTYLGSGLPI